MKKNVSGQFIAAQMNSRVDGSALTSGVTVYVTIDAGTQGLGLGTPVHEGNGCWSYACTQADTNGTHIAFTFIHATGVNQTVNVYTVDALVAMIDAPTQSEIEAMFAALNDVSVNEVWAKVIDGTVDATTALEHVLSMASGDIDKTGDDYVFKTRAGATLFTLSITAGSRIRS